MICHNCGNNSPKTIKIDYQLKVGRKNIDPKGKIILCEDCFNFPRLSSFLKDIDVNVGGNTEAIGFQIPNLEEQESEEEDE
jgi:hypothetical protein